MQDAIIVGAGGLGREIAAMLSAFFNKEYHILGFVDDGKEVGEEINGLTVLGGIEWLLTQKEIIVFFGIGNPLIKFRIYTQLKVNLGLSYPNLIHPNARLHQSEYISLGEGNIITDGCILTTNISIGNFNLINLGCTIGHDTEIGNFCSIMPGVNISGGAKLEDMVYVGTGAKLIKATLLGSGATIGAGAVVNTDVPAGKTYAGIPAKEIGG